MRMLILISICLIALTACGGGGGGSGGGASQPTTTAPTSTTPAGAVATSEPTVEFAPNTLLISDMIAQAPGQPSVRITSSCAGASCTLRTGSTSLEISLNDLLASPQELPGFEVTTETTKGGVDLYGFQAPVPIEGYGTFSATGYGAWLGKSAFITVQGTLDSGPLAGVSIAYGMSMGEATGSNPPVMGGATWTGAMSGVDYGRPNQAVTGTATLDIDNFSNPDIDVAFTGYQAAEPTCDGRT